MDVDSEPTKPVADSTLVTKPGSIIIETLVETFLVALQDDVAVADKENVVNGCDDRLSTRRYTVSLVRTSTTGSMEEPVQPKRNAQGLSSNGFKTEPKLAEASATEPTSNGEASAPSTSTAMEVEPRSVAADQAKEGTLGANKAVKIEASAASTTETGATPQPPVESKNLEDGEVVVTPPEPAAQSSPGQPTSATNDPSSSTSATKTVDAAPAAASPTPMDVIPSEPINRAPEVTKAPAAEPACVKIGPTPGKRTTTIEVLQRNLTPDDILFDADGISILSHEVENGMRKGWKIEARTWRWATDGLAAV